MSKAKDLVNGPQLDVLTWDYNEHTGPWCINHKSVQCTHAIAALNHRMDAAHIAEFLESSVKGTHFKLMVPLWTNYFMWEDLAFEVVSDQAIGRYGRLLNRGKFATYDLGVTKLLRGESAMDIGRTMVQQFSDIMELDRPTNIPGCKSGVHKMPYQRRLNELSKVAGLNEDATLQLMPHLYGLVGRETPMCAFCWADAYGGDARRVSDNPEDQAKVADFSDLLFEG